MHPLQGAVYSRSSSHQERLSKVILFLLIPPPCWLEPVRGVESVSVADAPPSSEVSDESGRSGCPEGPEPTPVLYQPQQWEAEALRTREAGAKE